VTTARTAPETSVAIANLIKYFETGTAPDDLFAPEVFADVSLPHWRLQAENVEATLAIRRHGHPFPGEVRVERVDQTSTGFTMEFEERWLHEGQRWYSREMIRADVVADRIVDMAVYCTGDWDEARQREHAAAVRLIRP
jgi:hypothetical protein